MIRRKPISRFSRTRNEDRFGRIRSRRLRRFEGFYEGDIESVALPDGSTDERIFGISILPDSNGEIPIVKEIKNYVKFLKSGRAPRVTYTIPDTPAERLAALKKQYGSDWKNFAGNPFKISDDGIQVEDWPNRQGSMGNLKALLVACVANNVLTEEEALDLVCEYSARRDLVSKLIEIAEQAPEYLSLMCNIDLSSQAKIDAFIRKCDTNVLDTNELAHGVGSHPHQQNYGSLYDSPKYIDAMTRITGYAPMDDDGKHVATPGPGKRADWEQSSYRAIAEQEANAYIDTLHSALSIEGTSTRVKGRDELVNKEDATDMLIALQADYQGKGANATGRRWADSWMGDPSQEDFGFDTAHAVYGGVSVGFGGFKRKDPEISPKTGKVLKGGKVSYKLAGRGENAPDWKVMMSILIAAPYVGSLDDPDAEHDLNAFCVAVKLAKVDGVSSVSFRDLERQLIDTFEEYVQNKGSKYGVKLVPNMNNSTAMCKATTENEQVAALRFLTRCACAALGECLDTVDGVDPYSQDSIRNHINARYVERRCFGGGLREIRQQIRNEMRRKNMMRRRMEQRRFGRR